MYGTTSGAIVRNMSRTPPSSVSLEMPKPTRAAGSASSTLSVRSWAMRRDRAAPNDSRMPSSRCRAMPRASIMFATSAQAMSSTSTKAAAIGVKKSANSGDNEILVARESSCVPVGVSRWRASGRCARIQFVSHASPWAVATPGRSRATSESASDPCGPNKPSSSKTTSFMVSGAQKSSGTSPRPPNPCAATPMTCSAWPRTRIVLPTIDESPPNRLRHALWLSTTTGSAPAAAASDAMSVLPNAATTPSIEK